MTLISKDFDAIQLFKLLNNTHVCSDDNKVLIVFNKKSLTGYINEQLISFNREVLKVDPANDDYKIIRMTKDNISFWYNTLIDLMLRIKNESIISIHQEYGEF